MPEDTRTAPDPGVTEEAHVKLASTLYSLLGGRWRWVVMLALASLLSGIAESGILAIVAEAAVSLVSGTHRANVNIGSLHFESTIGTLLLIALVLAVIRLGLQVVVSVLPARIAADVQADRRNALFNAYTQASWSMQSRDREGHLQEIVSNQMAQATVAALYTGNLLAAVLMWLTLIASALVLNVLAAVVVLVAALALFFLLRPVSTLGHRRSAELGGAYLDYGAAISEAVRLTQETHVFGVVAAQRMRVRGFVARIQDLFFKTQVLAALPTTMYQSVVYLIIVGGLAGLNGARVGHIASLGAVVLVLIRAGSYGQQAQGAYQYMQQALPWVERLDETERRYQQSAPRSGNRRLDVVRSVRFDGVSFAYKPGRPVLSNVTFEIAGGEAIGIVGPSGAGKSTFVQILLRLRAPSKGRYVINGSLAADFGDDDWHRRVAFVPQDPQLLHASIRDNIRFFRELDDDAVERAARLAAIHDDITNWPQGYDTIVGPRADAISGGQQQRICLARALAARPAILVLDEPTSAVDRRSEVLIQRSLAQLRSEFTLFVVAHRMSTLDICERVMVIVDGRLEAFDTAELLLDTNSYYRSSASLAAGTAPEASGSG